MHLSQKLGLVALLSVAALGTVSGCGGSRNSSDSDPLDFALGDGDVLAGWISGSTDLVHDATRGKLYYLDTANLDVAAVDLASGNESTLVALNFAPAMMRLTTDDQELYVLESADSADADDGFPDIVRCNVANCFVSAEPDIELDSGIVVGDFVATTNDRIVVASHAATSSPTPSEQYLSLINSFSGAQIDSLTFSGVRQLLALKWDQTTVLDEVMLNSSLRLDTVSIAGDSVDVSDTMDLTLAQGAINTWEPEGDRLFRSSGAVWDGDNDEMDLGASYESIDFDLEDERVVTLVERSGSFIVRFNELDSLELLSEQTIPAIEDAAGMEPVQLFVDDDNLYIVYREVTSDEEKVYLLVEFNYP